MTPPIRMVSVPVEALKDAERQAGNEQAWATGSLLETIIGNAAPVREEGGADLTPLADDPAVAALCDSNYRAGALAGWNAANHSDPAEGERIMEQIRRVDPGALAPIIERNGLRALNSHESPTVEADVLTGTIKFLEGAAAMLERGEMPAPGTPYAANWWQAHVVALSALATREEAPAEAGEPTPEQLEPFARKWCEANGIDPDAPKAPHGEWPEWYDACGPFAAMWRDIAAHLRAQPQAREEAQLVAGDWQSVAMWMGFAASVIKSGEPWTNQCQREFDEAKAAFARLSTTPPAPEAEKMRVALKRAKAVLSNDAISNAMRIVGAFDVIEEAITAMQQGTISAAPGEAD